MDILGLGKVLSEVIDNVIPDPDKKMELKLALATLDSNQMIAQSEVNKVEAGHRSIFVAGWRPAIGWIGASGLAMIYIVQPVTQLLSGQPVTIDTSELMVLITGMLGFGGLRSMDKYLKTSNDAPMGKPNEPIATPVKKKKILGIAVPPWLQ